MENSQQLLERAAKICLSVHAEQRDKAGKAYFQHPFRVAMNCETDDEKIVALLHDTVEDGDIDKDFLIMQNFPDHIVEAILLVTKREGEEYEEFIRRLAPNPLARSVKIKDIEDNLNLQRLDEIREKDLNRCNRYLKALRYLKEYKDRGLSEVSNNKQKRITRLNLHSDSIEKTDSLFYLEGNEWAGVGQLTTDGKIIILKDSVLRPTVTNTYSSNKLRNQILDQYCRKEDKGYRVLSDLPPMSPSTSSGLVLGRSSNGKVEWKDASGVPLATYIERLYMD